jgi:hypothetical protein
LSSSALTLLSPGRAELDGDFTLLGRDSTFGFVAGFAIAVPLDSPAWAYSIAHGDVVDLAGKNQITRKCSAAIERLFANGAACRTVSFSQPLSGSDATVRTPLSRRREDDDVVLRV